MMIGAFMQIFPRITRQFVLIGDLTSLNSGSRYIVHMMCSRIGEPPNQHHCLGSGKARRILLSGLDISIVFLIC